MKASIINGQLICGVDLSSRGARVIDISDEHFEEIKKGNFSLHGDELVITSAEQVELNEEQIAENERLANLSFTAVKKQEMLNLIESRYSIQDQLYILMDELGAGENTGFDDMLEFVRSMFAEFKKNGKDSDFSNYFVRSMFAEFKKNGKDSDFSNYME